MWVTSDGVATITDSTLIERNKNELVPLMRGLIGTIASEGSGAAFDTFLEEAAALDPVQYVTILII